MKASRPNILLIMADQLPAACVGTYGHPTIKTPNIDRLAERGTRFESAYCNSPICAPSRASLCAGRYPSELGAYDNGSDFPASTPTFMHHLGAAGYDVALSGKMHFIGPDQRHGFQRRLTPEIYPSSFTWTPNWNDGAIHNPGTAVDQLRDAGLCDWNLQLDYDEEVRFRALEALRDFARRPVKQADQPFFLCASFTHPHDPFVTTRDWWDLYDPDEIDLPAAPGASTMEQMHPYDQWLQIHHMIDEYPPAEDEIRNARHAYYGMVSYFDHCVGQLIDELDRLGLADDTLVVVTSDHGEMLGEHGMWFKRTYFDWSTRVPLIAAGPGVADGTCQETVSLIDLFPTFCELAGRTPDTASGNSLCGLLSGMDESSAWKDLAICEYLSEGVCEPMRMIVSDRGRWKYVHVRGHDELLFDLQEDPLEQRNLALAPEHQTRRQILREQLLTNWDPDIVREHVIASQQRRRTINLAHQANPDLSWDVQPDFDARQQYVRKQNAQEANVTQRIPRA